MLSHLIPGIEPLPFSATDASERRARLTRRFPARVAALEAACQRAPDPDQALAGAERFLDVTGAIPEESDLVEALALLCGASRMIARLLARDPKLLRRAARSPYLLSPRPEGAVARLLARAARGLDPEDVPGFHRLLRRVKNREVIRLALRDLRRARMGEVTLELSNFATACVDAAIRFHERRLRARHGPPAGLEEREPGAGFCALAMGKLGAGELNFSSDIDLIFVYGSDGSTRGPGSLTHFAYYAKLAELVTEAIATPTDDGFVFRVDLNLRPDGRSGPIVNSVRAAELYYQAFGRSWERNALVKARPAAGDLETGRELLALLEPFIWRGSLDLEVLSEIQAMKARIDARAGAEGERDLKLGRGGIREAEFFVSALQLLHGGKRRDLRERSMLAALDRLLFEGVVPARDRDALADAYLFLRRVEHRLQMQDGRQTHALPPEEERLPLARAMGMPTVKRFEQMLVAHRERVAGLFRDLLGTGRGEVKLDPELSLLCDPQVEAARRAELAVRRGFADPDRAVAAVEALGRRRTPFSPSGDPVAAVGLMQEVLSTPDPDQALGFLADFAAALRAPEPYFRLLSEQRRVARLLLSLFGTSDFLSKRFLRYPELLDSLLREDTVALTKDARTLGQELDERLDPPKPSLAPDSPLPRAELPSLDDLLERTLGRLRQFKNEEVLRIALHDIAGVLSLRSVMTQLSDLAEVCLVRCLALAEAEMLARGRLPAERLCVVAMGKLGGREMGYHSDVDLIFLYRSEGEQAGDAGTSSLHADQARLAQRLLSFLQMPLREGFLYKTDTRLRPSGNQGALVSSATGFARYHGADGNAPVRSQLWERQALLRARFVAGDRSLFAEIEERVLVPTLWREPADRAGMAAEVRRMRERIETELGQEAARGANPKAGRGGLVDVEFATQYLQLAYGYAHPSIRSPSTPDALSSLREVGLLREGSYRALARGYEFLRRLDLRLRIVHDYTVDHLPRPGSALAQLARRLGYHGEDPGARLMADYARVTGEVRAAFEETLR
ncbi:MAG TPA: bifunctional [glutamate--ammonia ligase]-adenylyl-L-tyrosine phosphorylase/[glutamate--ammonia-ligase] adenylyltransferase [Anaeromyxobacteraceae bacterium]|nr:bifunctional [glutamate--ammonia ligase]-adenylyl-L-tyrosine phosphorylase/[glutamate--ammonia-ligase] adenylyltransferase [Anaeromyxobacteraceae bacterium]